MFISLTNHKAAAPPASAPQIADEHETLMLFAPNDALEKLMPAASARRFADLRSSLREANARHGPRRIKRQPGSLDRAATPLREATKHYERHVLAWYALGRQAEARSAHEAIVHYRQALAPEPTPHEAAEPYDAIPPSSSVARSQPSANRSVK
jgi:hypothetical protein